MRADERHAERRANLLAALVTFSARRSRACRTPSIESVVRDARQRDLGGLLGHGAAGWQRGDIAAAGRVVFAGATSVTASHGNAAERGYV